MARWTSARRARFEKKRLGKRRQELEREEMREYLDARAAWDFVETSIQGNVHIAPIDDSPSGALISVEDLEIDDLNITMPPLPLYRPHRRTSAAPSLVPESARSDTQEELPLAWWHL